MTEATRTGSDGTTRRAGVVVLGAVALAVLAALAVAPPAAAHAAGPPASGATPGSTALQAGGGNDPALCGQSADPLVGTYNENVDDVPGVVRDRVRDTRIHGVVNGPGGGEYTFVTGPDGRIETYSEGAPDDATLRMITDCESLGAIVGADAPADAFRREYRNDEIRFVGVGPVNRALVTWLDLAVTGGEVISRLTPLGIQTGVTVAALLFPLAIVGVLLVLGYVGYRRFSIVRHRRRRARAAARTDAGGDGEVPGGDGGGTGGDGGGGE